ncbi:MAG: hypothetical protein LH616_07960 [Ilumatobacteraceae bacterium]|nr:hypothetical protein [Ilumatobacteraceae bacterium]
MLKIRPHGMFRHPLYRSPQDSSIRSNALGHLAHGWLRRLVPFHITLGHRRDCDRCDDDLTALALGTDFVSTTGASWIDEAAGTWDATQKLSARGEVSWPMARYTETGEGSVRSISSNGLPLGMVAYETQDECHGRVSTIELDGVIVEMYHYSVIAEFPFFIGCYRGTPT